MPANRSFAFAPLALGWLLVTGACVNLTRPWEKWSDGGGQGGTTPEPETATTVDAPGTGGTEGTTTSGNDGTTTDGTSGVDAASTGGAGTGGTGAVATGGEIGSDAGGAGGVDTGGAGGIATGGTMATGGSTRPRDAAVSPDQRTANEVATRIEVARPPDAKIDLPAVPDATAVPDVPQVPDGPAPPDTPPSTVGLILYYSCNEVSDTTLPDKSGNGNDGTLVGPVSVAPGKVGNALSFTATNNLDSGTSGGYVVMPAALLATSATMTIAAWFKINSTVPFQRIFDIGTSDITSSMYLTPRDGTTPNSNLRFSIRTTLADGGLFKEDLPATPVKTVPTGTWEHVAVVLDASGARLYLNGVQVGVSTAMTMRPTSLGSTTNDWIGRSEFAVNPYLDGAIDEFRIYNRALSAAEILTLYNAQ